VLKQVLFLFEIGQSLVKRWPGKIELTRDVSNRLSFDQCLTKHFVFDLQQVPEIEKVALLE